MDTKGLKAIFEYHPATEKTAPMHEQVRKQFLSLAQRMNKLLPESREKSLAITNLQDAMMFANAAIAIHTTDDEPPADEKSKAARKTTAAKSTAAKSASAKKTTAKKATARKSTTQRAAAQQTTPPAPSADAEDPPGATVTPISAPTRQRAKRVVRGAQT